MAGAGNQDGPRAAVSLTAKQLELLEFLKANPCATYRDMMAGVGTRSLGAISERLDDLEERGHIRRLRCRSGIARNGGVEVIPQIVTYQARGQRFMFIPVGV